MCGLGRNLKSKAFPMIMTKTSFTNKEAKVLVCFVWGVGGAKGDVFRNRWIRAPWSTRHVTAAVFDPV